MVHNELELVIFTRSAKKRLHEVKSKMVRLNAETLHEYFCYPLGTAARSLGLSETSLKRCLIMI